MNLLQSCKIYHLVSIGYRPHRHKKSFLGKNFRQYLPMGAWLTIALVALVHKEFEWPKYYNQGPPLIYNSSIELRLLSNNFRKFFSLRSATWKFIFHWERTESYFHFLLKSYNDLHGKIGIELKLLKSLSTSACSGYCCLLGQFQNLMQLWTFFKKNFLSSCKIATKWI